MVCLASWLLSFVSHTVMKSGCLHVCKLLKLFVFAADDVDLYVVDICGLAYVFAQNFNKFLVVTHHLD